VNPSTFFNVLRGKKAKPTDRVVPVGHYRALLLGIYSHGWSHEIYGKEEQARKCSRVACDICHAPHTTPRDHEHSSLFTREWYFHFPYETEDDTPFQWSAHAQHEHHRSLAYWAALFQVGRLAERGCNERLSSPALLVRRLSSSLPPFLPPAPTRCFVVSCLQAYHYLITAAPTRPIIALHNFCGAAGTLKFMKYSEFGSRYGVNKWYGHHMWLGGQVVPSMPDRT